MNAVIRENLIRENSSIEAESRISPLGGTIYRLEITGRLAPGWIGRISTGLANYRINVIRFKAAKITAADWSADLELDFSASSYLPANVDYITLAKETKTPLSVESVKLSTFVVEKSPKHGGSLYIELTGADRIGFLASLVNMFGMYSLNPVEALIETIDNRVYDRFWLKGLGGSTPSDSAASAVSGRLSAFAS